ncbi:MAG TPA: hypothetical protein VKC66_07025 [Xanthobacteraceae bacterium]|nr:hypothetical protein [Xanthobacteraceae bacterium]
MTTAMPNGSMDGIIEEMLELAGCSLDHRIILAGSTRPDRIFEFRRRGFSRVVTTATCKLFPGQYDVAFVEWQRHSIEALEATLDWLVHFLSPAGILVIWIDTAPGHHKLRLAIERLGFRVDTGTRCKKGFAVSARRLGIGQRAMAA